MDIYPIYLNNINTNVISTKLSNEMLNHISTYLTNNEQNILRYMIKDFDNTDNYNLIIQNMEYVKYQENNDSIDTIEMYYFIKNKKKITKIKIKRNVKPLWLKGNLSKIKENITLLEIENINLKKVGHHDFVNIYIIKQDDFKKSLRRLINKKILSYDNVSEIEYKNIKIENLQNIINICLNELDKKIFPKKILLQ